MAFVVIMATFQGYTIISGISKMVSLFDRWHIGTEGMRYFGSLTLICVVLILFPQTFIIGNFLMAATILWIICMQLSIKNIKGAAIEIPYLLMNLLLVYMQYPKLYSK